MITIACFGLAAWALAARRRPPSRAAGADAAVPAAPGRPRAIGWVQRLPSVLRRPRPSALPEVVDGVAAAVRAGRSIADGLSSAAAQAPGPLAAELRAIAGATEHGVPVRVAVERWSATSSEPGADLVAAAVGLAGDAGGDVAGALAGVADTLRERRALGREIRALSAQARLSALVVALAPAAFAAVAALADPATARFLLATAGGWVCLGAGAALDLAGWRWMRRITATIR